MGENEQLRNRCNALDQEIIVLKAQERRIPPLEQKITLLNDELQFNLNKIKELNASLASKQDLISQQEIELLNYLLLQSEYNKLKSFYESKTREFEEQRTNLQKFEKSLSETKVLRETSEKNYQTTLIELEQLKKKLEFSKKDAEELASKLSKQTELASDSKRAVGRATELQ